MSRGKVQACPPSCDQEGVEETAGKDDDDDAGEQEGAAVGKDDDDDLAEEATVGKDDVIARVVCG